MKVQTLRLINSTELFIVKRNRILDIKQSISLWYEFITGYRFSNVRSCWMIDWYHILANHFTIYFSTITVMLHEQWGISYHRHICGLMQERWNFIVNALSYVLLALNIICMRMYSSTATIWNHHYGTTWVTSFLITHYHHQLPVINIWKHLYQRQLLRSHICNHLPLNSVRCNYLSMP